MQFVRKSKGDTKSADNLLIYIRQANLSSGLKIYLMRMKISPKTRDAFYTKWLAFLIYIDICNIGAII
jgi:hypothetical protein